MLHAHVFFTIPLGSSDMTQSGTDQHECGVAVGESPYHARSAPDLTVQTLNDIVGTDFQPMLNYYTPLLLLF